MGIILYLLIHGGNLWEYIGISMYPALFGGILLAYIRELDCVQLYLVESYWSIWELVCIQLFIGGTL